MIPFLSVLSFLACTGASPEVAEAAVEGVHADVITLSEAALANANLRVPQTVAPPCKSQGDSGIHLRLRRRISLGWPPRYTNIAKC